MKKGLIFFLVLIVLGIGAIYLFIPAKLLVAREVLLDASSLAVYRNVSDQNNWAKWWPVRPGQPGEPGNDSAKSGDGYTYDGYQFNLTKTLFKTAEVVMKKDDKEYSSAILFIPLQHDSALIRWEIPMENGSNPITRVSNYFKAKKIANTISGVLKSLKPFVEIEENLYGISVKHSTVADTAFVSTTSVFNHFPTTEEIYAMIEKLHAGIAKQNGKEKGFPMLNIDSSAKNPAEGSGKGYEVMVAIATERLLKDEGDVNVKRMIRGNILIAEVTGGPYTIRDRIAQMREYVRDHQMTAAAIPFQLLVTDRLKEKDTTKWVTELRYPVF